jgi:hypothetical protein
LIDCDSPSQSSFAIENNKPADVSIDGFVTGSSAGMLQKIRRRGGPAQLCYNFSQ